MGLVVGAPLLAIAHHRVLINRDHTNAARVLIDSTVGAREAVHHLADLRHQHLAYVAGPEASWSNAERVRAVEAVAKARVQTVTTVPSAASAVVAFDDQIARGDLAGLN